MTSAATTTTLRNGTYTIASPRGEHRTFMIRTQKEDARFAPGQRIVALLTGIENDSDDSYEGFGFVGEHSITVWRSKASGGNARHVHQVRYPCHDVNRWGRFEQYAAMLLDLTLERSWLRARGYELLCEARCCKCNRKLTTPESIGAGIGPECAGRV